MTGLRRPGLLLGAAVLVSGGVAGCASETERYCGELADSKQALTDLAVADDDAALDETLELLQGLHDAAPGDIEDEWSTLVFAYQGLVEAFDAAGTSPAEYDPASPPEGVSAAEAERIEGAAAELASRRVLTAADGLEQHAQDVCKVDLGLGSGER